MHLLPDDVKSLLLWAVLQRFEWLLLLILYVQFDFFHQMLDAILDEQQRKQSILALDDSEQIVFDSY